MAEHRSLLDQVATVVGAAGEAILAVYAREDVGEQTKADASPVTAADHAAQAVLAEGLAALQPALPVLSEEALVPRQERQRWQRYWLVDPLDGTREFLARNDEFTVNVALVERGAVVAGVVGVPVRGELWVGSVSGGWAERRDARGARALHVQPLAARGGPPVLVASRHHRSARQQALVAALTEAFGPLQERAVGSALKLLLLAAGEADLYPRIGPTSEWDIAAAEAVLRGAGGRVVRLDGQPLAYNKDDLLNPDFIAVADPAALPRVLAACQRIAGGAD